MTCKSFLPSQNTIYCNTVILTENSLSNGGCGGTHCNTDFLCKFKNMPATVCLLKIKQ